MSPRPRISVVMPVYNGERFIAEALRSLLEQSWTDWEAWVIDDGSTDGTAAQVNRLADQDRRITLLHHPARANCGVSRSRRLGIDHAAGEFIAFLDGDDTWQPEKLERQIAVMQDVSDASPTVLCHTGVRFIEELPSASTLHLEAELHFVSELTRYDPRAQSWFGHSNPICASSVLCRAEPLRRLVRGFNQLFQYEDWTWWTLLSSEGAFAFLPERLTGYRMHDAAATARLHDAPLREVYSKLEHWLAVGSQASDAALRELAMDRLAVTLGEAAACYAESGTANAQQLAAALDRAALLTRLGEHERELARLRRFWPRRLAGWWRRWRSERNKGE